MFFSICLLNQTLRNDVAWLFAIIANRLRLGILTLFSLGVLDLGVNV